MDWYCAEYEIETVYELHDGQTASWREELDATPTTPRGRTIVRTSPRSHRHRVSRSGT